MKKTVLIATPTCGIDPDPSRWLDSLMKIQNQIRALGMGQAFLSPYRMMWWPANNHIWEQAIRYDFDYLLRLDDDVWGVPDDAIAKLVAADKDVIGAAYPSRHYPHVWCALNRAKEFKDKNLVELYAREECTLVEVEGDGILPVDQIGFGMTLIRPGVFAEKMKEGEKMFQGEETCPDDTYFAQKCIDLGIQQYVHMDIKLCHRDITPMLRVKKAKPNREGKKS